MKLVTTSWTYSISELKFKIHWSKFPTARLGIKFPNCLSSVTLKQLVAESALSLFSLRHQNKWRLHLKYTEKNFKKKITSHQNWKWKASISETQRTSIFFRDQTDFSKNVFNQSKSLLYMLKKVICLNLNNYFVSKKEVKSRKRNIITLLDWIIS